jgi:protein O-mannosyl-transferase
VILLEKLPLLALSFASSLVTVRAHEALGALISATELPVPQRLANAVVTYALYLRKIVWPVDLSVFYMHPGRWPTGAVVGSAVLLLAITAVALWQLRARPFLLVGWLWFLGALVPTIGLVQAHVQAMADRFAYVPVIGVFLMLVWGAADLGARWPQRTWTLPGAAGAALVGCVVMTSLQLQYWRNSLTLLEHAVRLAPTDHVAQVMLGNAYFERGRLDEALERYLESTRLRPDYAEAWQRAAVALSQKQRVAEAIEHFRTAIRLSPNWTEPHRGLAQVLAGLGRVEEARAEYQTLERLLPADAGGQMRLA